MTVDQRCPARVLWGGLAGARGRGAVRGGEEYGSDPEVEEGLRRDADDSLVLAREERPARDHFRQDAADRPHVEGLVVHAERQHDLGRAVPARRDVFRHETLGALGGDDGLARAREPKVAHFEVAIGVEQQVGGLQVAVDDWGGRPSAEGEGCGHSLREGSSGGARKGSC